ncbi:MAG: FtsQ-type POTRA domain-containing protein [Trueperella sp.]|nr:FtsQ-type POTRA domain-containing protein [Trueperella sp.]
MREPRKPRKPSRIVPAAKNNRSSGGELPPQKVSQPIPESVATAPMPAPRNEDFIIEEPLGEPAPTEPVPQTANPRRKISKPRLPSKAAAPDTPSRYQRILTATKTRFGESKNQLSAAARNAVRINGPIELSARRAEKKREARRFRLKRIGIIGGTVTAVALLVWALFFSSLLGYSFQAGQIKLAENSIVNRSAVEQVVAAHSGEPVLRLNRNKLATEITAKVPEVKTAKVTLALPTGLEIVVVPHEPVACLLANDACTALAEDGTKLNIAPELANALPVVVAGEGAKLSDVVPTALEVLGELSAPTREQIAKVEITGANLVTLQLDGGRTAYWGEPTQNSKKAEILAVLLTQPANFYDISAPTTPVSR